MMSAYIGAKIVLGGYRREAEAERIEVMALQLTAGVPAGERLERLCAHFGVYREGQTETDASLYERGRLAARLAVLRAH